MLHSIKNFIKSNSITKYLYAKVQCLYTKVKYYYINNTINKKVTYQKFKKISLNSNVLYIGTDELQDKSGFLQELELFCNLKLFTKYDNSYGQYSEKSYKEGYGPELNTKRLEELLLKLQGENFIPNILIMQSWGRLWDIDKLRILKQKYNFKIINICMDDRHSFYMLSPFRKYNRGSSGLIPILDYALVTSKESVDWYHSKGVPSLYFPEATSLQIFNKIKINKKYDVGFVGAKYGLRGEYIQYLIDNSVNVKAYGNGWKSGRIENEYVNQFFNECKIVIGFGYILGCSDFMALKLRDFDVPATGSFYLTTYNKDLEELFPEKQDCYFNNKQEMLEKVKFFLKNDKLREDIASKSYENVLKNHTYKNRFELIFEELI